MTVEQIIDGLKHYDPKLPIEVQMKDPCIMALGIVGFNVGYENPGDTKPCVVYIKCIDFNA
jgi:hypothetical protein